MENKYYTPTIDEFHEGFTLQIKTVDTNEWRDTVFKMSNMSFNVDGIVKEHAIVHWLRRDDVRVKYLDSADIEECGWFLKSEGNVLVFKRNEPRNPNEPEEFLEYWHLNLHEDGTVVVHNAGYYESEIIIFYGKIKNKSELKKIMKMINIF